MTEVVKVGVRNKKVSLRKFHHPKENVNFLAPQHQPHSIDPLEILSAWGTKKNMAENLH